MPENDLEAALERLDRIIGTFENESDEAVRERVFELLESVDAVHRRLVWYLGERLYQERPELFERLLEDPVAGVLFEMYGLISPTRREGAPAQAAEEPVAFVGVGDLEASIPPPLGWYHAAREDEVREGSLLTRDVEGERLILARAGGEIHVYRDLCPGTPMPLNAGVIRGGLLLCPWHDCRFDLRTGERTDREGEGLAGIPLAVRDGEVRAGLRVRKRSAA